MNILYIIHDTDWSAGSAKSLISLIEITKNNGHKVFALCPNDEGLTKILGQNNVIVLVKPYLSTFLPINKEKKLNLWFKNYLYKGISLIYNLRAISYFKKILKEINPDIIHENTSVTNIGYHLAKKLNKPYIMHIREYGDKDFNWKIIGLKKRLKDPMTNTISITKDIQRHHGLTNKINAYQIYNGIISIKDIIYNPLKKKYFLYAGRIEKAKGIKELLQSFYGYVSLCEVNDIEPISLMMVGNFEIHPLYHNECLQYAKEKNIENKIQWLGNREDVKEFYYNTLATIIPSISEGLGRVLPEALCNGSLCVCRNSGGSKEQMELGREFTGGQIAIPYIKEKVLSEILLKITINYNNNSHVFQEKGEYFKIIHNGQKYIKEFVSIEKFEEKILNVYNSISNKLIN